KPAHRAGDGAAERVHPRLRGIVVAAKLTADADTEVPPRPRPQRPPQRAVAHGEAVLEGVARDVGAPEEPEDPLAPRRRAHPPAGAGGEREERPRKLGETEPSVAPLLVLRGKPDPAGEEPWLAKDRGHHRTV